MRIAIAPRYGCGFSSPCYIPPHGYHLLIPSGSLLLEQESNSVSLFIVGRFFGTLWEGSAPRVSVAGSHCQAYQDVLTASLGVFASSGAVPHRCGKRYIVGELYAPEFQTAYPWQGEQDMAVLPLAIKWPNNSFA
jgi:hypothetical protein